MVAVAPVFYCIPTKQSLAQFARRHNPLPVAHFRVKQGAELMSPMIPIIISMDMDPKIFGMWNLIVMEMAVSTMISVITNTQAVSVNLLAM